MCYLGILRFRVSYIKFKVCIIHGRLHLNIKPSDIFLDILKCAFQKNTLVFSDILLFSTFQVSTRITNTGIYCNHGIYAFKCFTYVYFCYDGIHRRTYVERPRIYWLQRYLFSNNSNNNHRPVCHSRCLVFWVVYS